MFIMWVRSVSTLMCRLCAISLLERPLPRAFSTSISRGVSCSIFALASRSSSRVCPARRSSSTSSSGENSVSPAARRRVEDLVHVGGLVQDAGRPGFYGAGVILPVEARGHDQRREERVGLAQVLDKLDSLTVG